MEKKQLSKKVIGWACVLVFTMTLGITSAVFAQAPATIKLGAVIALTGAMASGGKDVRDGYRNCRKTYQ